METVSRYKLVIKDIATVYGLFLCYKNTTPTHYKQLVSGWGIDELCTLLGEVEAINIEAIKQEIYSLDGEPLKRFVKDLREYIPNYGAVIESLKSDELLAILEKIHGSKKAHLIIDNLTAIAMTAITKIGNVALILKELQPQEEQPQRQVPQEPSTERAKKAFKKALEAGYMEETDTGYRWLYNNGSKVSLGYFLVQVYDPDGSKETPFIALGKLFNITRLDSYADKAINEVKKPQKWREPLHELLKDL